MNFRNKSTKGYISFIALILVMIASLFIFYFINMRNTNAIGIDVKHSLDRSTKGASAMVDEELLSKGFFKIDADKSKETFETLINENLFTENKIKLTPIEQYNGKNYIYQYNGYEDLTTKQSKLDKTPKITYFVFNAENEIVSNRPEDVEDYVAYIKNALQSVRITDNAGMDKEIKDTIFSELTGKNMDGIPTNIEEPKVKDTRSFVLAVAEIPTNTFSGRLGAIYRFSTSRLNSKIDTVQENSSRVIHGLRGEYYEHTIEKVNGTPVPPTNRGRKLAERIDKTINFNWGTYEPHPNVPADGFTIEWTGLVKAPATGTIVFETNSDDGVRLWVDNTLIIDKWMQQSPTSWTGTITLTEGEWYPIKLQYYENTGSAVVRLSWKYGDMSTSQVIPSPYLLPYSTDYNGDAPIYSKRFTIEEPTGIFRFREIIEVPVQFDDDKMVKNVHNMTLLYGGEKIPFIMEDIVRKSDGSIKKGTIVFVDDINANQKKTYDLVFSEGIIYYPPSSGIEVVDDSNYVTVKNNSLYTLKFRKASKAGYTQAYVNGSSYDAIGEKPDRNFFFSNSNAKVNSKGTHIFSDWSKFEGFQIIEQNAIYTKVRYEVMDVNNVLKYYLETTYYKDSPIIKNTVYDKNISSEPVYSFYDAHTPMLERTSEMDGMEAWGVATDNQVVSGEQYEKVANYYKATGVAFWNNQKNFHIGLHSLQGVAHARFDEQFAGGRMDLSYDNEQEILQPGGISKKLNFWMSVSHKDYLGDGKAVAQNITLRLANPVTVNIPDTFNILNKPNPPTIVPSKTGIIQPGEQVTFDIESYVDDKGNPIVDVQWEGRTPNDRYRGGMHTVKARVKNNLGLWSDWTEYNFNVKFTILEVYPFAPQLQGVIDNYASGQIDVKSISINDFNSQQPNISQYDMIMFGFADCYGSKDISDAMAQKVETFIQSGKGVLFSHDTIWGPSKNFTKYFAKYLNLDIDTDETPYTGTEWWSSGPIFKTKEGKLTEYPYELPDSITIQPSHWQWYRTGGDVWYALNPNNPQGTWFVTSYQNVVHITSGHETYSCGGTPRTQLRYAPADEQKLLINTIYYTSQFRASEIIEEPTAKISAISSSGVSDLYYRGNTVTLDLYDKYLPNGDIMKYEWRVTEKFGQQKTYSYSTAKPTFTINAPGNITPEYEIKVRFYDALNVPSDWITKTITITNRPPNMPTVNINNTQQNINGKIKVYLTPSATDPDGDTVTYEWDGKASNDLYPIGTNVVKVRAKDSHGAYSAWQTVTFITNRPPNMPTITVNKTRTVKNGKFLVTLTPNTTDPDGDSVTYEWDGKTSDNYYSVGTHTVKVRAKDVHGAYSDWGTVTFTVVNNPPNTPVITRTPSGTNVSPNDYVTIKANATDPDGDPVTYVWSGRIAETAKYPLGKQVITVKAVDSAGAESQPAAIVFFVVDPYGGGGMMLTGPESRIYEDGIEGATIIRYTFNVPSVSGHYGNDYAWVKGYNRNNGQWEQIDYRTTTNGIYMEGTLPKGKYTKLEFFYYASHCMYGKSNITYTVEYSFD